MKPSRGKNVSADSVESTNDKNAMQKLDATLLNMMIMAARNTRPVELTCDECWEEVDKFAELTLAGKNAAEAMPLVQAHLETCPECLDEFNALLAVLRARL